MDYISEAMRTENTDFEGIRNRLHLSNADIRLLHAVMGISTEAGELLDAYKKSLFYGRTMDTVNIVEELGDLLWYIAQAASAIGTTFERIQTRNLAKLTKRYPGKFTGQEARQRDLTAEREALEGVTGPIGPGPCPKGLPGVQGPAGHSTPDPAPRCWCGTILTRADGPPGRWFPCDTCVNDAIKTVMELHTETKPLTDRGTTNGR